MFLSLANRVLKDKKQDPCDHSRSLARVLNDYREVIPLCNKQQYTPHFPITNRLIKTKSKTPAIIAGVLLKSIKEDWPMEIAL